MVGVSHASKPPSGKEAGDASPEALQPFDGDEIVGGGQPRAHVVVGGGEGIELAGRRFASDALDPVAHDPRRDGVEHRPDGRALLVAEAGQVGFHQFVSERGAQRDRVVERGDAVGMAVRAVGRARGERDAQPPGVGAHLVGEGPRRRGRPVRVARRGTGGGVEQPGRVAHRTSDGVLDGPAADDVAVLRSDRVASAGGFEPEQSAGRRRIADRSAEVVGVGHRHHARCDGGGRSAARAARRAIEAPRVARRAERERLARRGHAELGRVRLAEHDEAGPLEAQRELGVVVRHVVAQETRALAEPHALHLERQVFDQERHAAERSARAGGRAVERPLEHRRDHRVERGVQRLDAGDGRLHELGGGHLAAGHELGLRGCVERGQLVGRGVRGHRAAASRSAAAFTSPERLDPRFRQQPVAAASVRHASAIREADNVVTRRRSDSRASVWTLSKLTTQSVGTPSLATVRSNSDTSPRRLR